MKITFLGTSSMMPTKDRNAFSVLINHETDNILVDCGEGTQRQLRQINFSPSKINKILITHWHGDHVLGIPGLLQTLAGSEYSKVLEIYGPKGTKKFMKSIMSMFLNQNKIKLNIKEINKNGKFYENNLINMEAVYLDHTAPCLAYSIIENEKRKMNLEYLKKYGLSKHPLLGKLQKGKSIIYKGKKISVNKATYLLKGKKITVITDTKLCNQCYEISKDSDILVCEATFMKNLKDKASDYKHLTTEQAAQIAKQSKSKKLILTHISQRYESSENKKIELEAKNIFKEVVVANDLMKIDF